jgi:hypothetical protein
MTDKIKLSEYKRQIYLFYSEDGLADLAIGLMIFGFGILLLVGLPAFVGLLTVIPLFLWFFGKQILVEPRVGSIQPGTEIKNRFLGFFINLIVLGLGILIFFLINQRTGTRFISSYSLSLFGLVLAVGISALGLLLRASRFYVYGLIVFLFMAVGEFLLNSLTAFDPYLTAVISAGLIIIISGLVSLIRFIRKYPVQEWQG